MERNISEITNENFISEVHQNDQPVLVVFSAEWCGLCHIIEPIIDRVATQFTGKIKVCKIDCDSNHSIKNHYGIHALPTLLVFNQGEIVGHIVGAVSQVDLLKMLKGVLKSTSSLKNKSSINANQQASVESNQKG